jgi:hypothetical protein
MLRSVEVGDARFYRYGRVGRATVGWMESGADVLAIPA